VHSLVEGFEATGLWPVVLESLPGDDERPWLNGELDPAGSTDPTTHDARVVLEALWKRAIPSGDETDEAFGLLAPFGREFPGLAPATESTANGGGHLDAVDDLSGRLGLVSVVRPADALAAIGWLGPVNYYADMGTLSAVLRSWEDRFGAFLVGVGFNTITVAVDNPPATFHAAQVIAAEHFAACSDNVYQGSGSIEAYAEELVAARSWSFWWD
jgi:hypothetical protein